MIFVEVSKGRHFQEVTFNKRCATVGGPQTDSHGRLKSRKWGSFSPDRKK